MNLVERHIIRRKHKDFKELDHLCFLSKNLYNATLYAVRQQYVADQTYLNFPEVNKLFIRSNNPDYRALPAKVSKDTQRLLDRNYKSFFALVEEGLPARLPRYLDKKRGRQVVHYEKGALSFKTGKIQLSKTHIFIQSRIPREQVQFVRVVPKGHHIVLEVGYRLPEPALRPKADRFAALDLGVNNLATVVSNVFDPVIVNGRPLKSINHHFNKLKAKEQSKGSNLEKLSIKRFCKISDYLHKTSSWLTKHLASNQIDTLIIGYNPSWKQEVNLGKKNNQNFVQIPHREFISKLEYKCRLVGIEVILREESYTSKASFMDQETVGKKKVYQGKRIKRGLYQTATGRVVNADVNAAYNILRKHLKARWNSQSSNPLGPNFVQDCLQRCSTAPRKTSIPGWKSKEK